MESTQGDLERQRQAGTDDETLGPLYHAKAEDLNRAARKARAIRDDIILRLKATHGPTKTATIMGLSLSTIKNVKGQPRPRSKNWPLNIVNSLSDRESEDH